MYDFTTAALSCVCHRLHPAAAPSLQLYDCSQRPIGAGREEEVSVTAEADTELISTFKHLQQISVRILTSCRRTFHPQEDFIQTALFLCYRHEDVIDQVTRHDWPFPQSRPFWLCAPITVRFRSSSGQTDPQFYITTAVTSV